MTATGRTEIKSVVIGDFIRLNNNWFVKCFHESKEWRNDYLYTNHFQHVSLWFSKLNCRGEYAKSFFESSISQVVSIERDDEGSPLFLTTELFWICFPEAIASNEIEILSSQSKTTKELKSDRDTIQDLEFFEIEYKNDLFDILERENNKKSVYERGFFLMSESGKWDHLK